MNSNLKRFLVIIGMVFIAWILILAFSTAALFHSFYGVVGFCGSILAFVLSTASLLLWKADPERDTAEVNAALPVYTGTYFILAFIANTVFCFMSHLDAPRIIPLVVNALLTIAFVTVRMFILPYRDRVSRTVLHTAEKTRGAVRLSAKLSEIMGMAQDEAVKQRLRELKEQLDYSTNVSQPFTADLEAVFFGQLCDISNAIDQHAPSEDVLKRIDATWITWKKRNGASSMN